MGCCFSACRTPRLQNINRWILLGLTILSWIFSVVSLGTCSFVALPGYSDSKGLGLFSLDLNGNCVRYSNTSMFGGRDGGRDAAQAFGTLACLTLSCALVGVTSSILILPTPVAQIAWWVTRILYCLAEACVLFTFTFYGSFVVSYICDDPDFCVLGSGGTVTALNVWVLIIILSICFVVPEPDQPILSLWDITDDIDDGIEEEISEDDGGGLDRDCNHQDKADNSIQETSVASFQPFDESPVNRFSPYGNEDQANSLAVPKSYSLPFQESIDLPSSEEEQRKSNEERENDNNL